MKDDGISNHAFINGLNMYYEIHGAGSPLVLLHGGLTTIEGSFRKILPSLAEKWQVIAPEQQAHGRTADIERPLTYVQMAEDTVELLRQLKVKRADFFGYSVGTGVALQIAIRHPDLVRKLILVGGVTYKPDGFYPDVLAGIDYLTPENLAGTVWEKGLRRGCAPAGRLVQANQQGAAVGSGVSGLVGGRNPIDPGAYADHHCRFRYRPP